LAGLHRASGAVAKALDAGGARAPLAGRTVPVDAPRLGGAPLRGGQGPGRATPGVDVTHALLDRRAHLGGLGVEDLVSEHEPVGLDGEHAAGDVHDVAHAQLALIAHVAVGGHAETAAAARVVEAETKRVQEPVRGVAEAREVEGDREVIVVVHLPAIHDAAIRLAPAAHSVSSFEALRIRPSFRPRAGRADFRQSVAYTSPGHFDRV